MSDQPYHTEVERRLQSLATNLIDLQFAAGDVKVVDEGEGPHALSSEFARIFLTRMSHEIMTGGSTPLLASDVPITVEFAISGTDDDVRRAARAVMVDKLESYLFCGRQIHRGDHAPAAHTSVDWSFATAAQGDLWFSVAKCQFVLRWQERREVAEDDMARLEQIVLKEPTGGLVIAPNENGAPIFERKITLTSDD